MILQALKGYYDRLSADPDTKGVPLLGFARQKVHFCLVLDKTGKLIAENDLRLRQDKKALPLELIVPEPVIRSGLTVRANFLWDNTGYVLGADNKEKPARLVEKFNKFKSTQREVCGDLQDEGMQAVLRFLDDWNPENAVSLSDWKEMAGQNIVFRLDGETRYVHDRPEIRGRWMAYYAGKAAESKAGMCLVSGSEGPIARIHQSIKGVPGAQTSGAALVSFNLDAFTSYGKDQNLNAPIGEEAAFGYCTALNWLLRKESRQKVRIGDAIITFWAEKESLVEGLLADLLGADISQVETDAEDKAVVRDVRIILEAARDGRLQDAVREPETRFYVLALSPNASRLSVRFWHVGTVGEIICNISDHFRHMEIKKSFDNEPAYPSARSLMRETVSKNDPGTAWEKDERVSPLLAGAFLRSVLTGAPYPGNLLPLLLMRIRMDQTVNYLRAALIKACLVRNYNLGEVSVALDKNSTDTGYRLGRLFAVFERIQSAANPGINSTIRDKYFGSAAATPRNIFPMLWSLSQQHIGKLRKDSEKKRLAGFFDAKIEDIASALDATALPAFLNPESQGLFFLGYYHQRQDLFTGKTEHSEEE
ncbi:MAG: type I-C CRISPR-associated protein Cas8c/Csd1 [Syntrophobacter sp.]